MTENKNPFLKPYNTPHDTAPFHLIKIEHYEPALLEGMKEQNEEIDAIVNNPEAPTFQNTIVALEKSGALLDRVTTVFGNLMSAETSDEMQELAEKMMPVLSEHSNNISLNEKLFARIKAVYEQKDQLQLKGEDAQLLQKTYDGFVRSGANLTGEAKEKFRQLNTELSILTLRFSQNLLKETNNYELALTEKQLEGLPESSLESYAQTAKDKGKEGSIITLDAPSFVPFMKYCDDRSLRREVYMAYNTQCTHNNEYNNVDIIKQLVNIRMELAHLLGFSTFAEYKLKKRMAETSDAVYKLLNQLLDAYTPAALKEVAEVEALAREMEGNDFQLMPWDWAYYSEKLKNKKFNLNEEELRPYFELSQVEKGVFGLATRLYGITFKENKEIPVYHPDVKAYEVFDKDGSFLAVLYTDFHPRAGKRSGAWMTSYKEQWIENGVNSRPQAIGWETGIADFLRSKHFSTRIRTRLARNVCQYHLFNHEWYQRILGFCGASITNYGKFRHRKRISQYIRQTLSNGRTHSCRTDPKNCRCIQFQCGLCLPASSKFRLAGYGMVHPPGNI